MRCMKRNGQDFNIVYLHVLIERQIVQVAFVPIQCISSMYTSITSALKRPISLSQWVLSPWSPSYFMPLEHLTLHAIFKRHEQKSIQIK